MAAFLLACSLPATSAGASSRDLRQDYPVGGHQRDRGRDDDPRRDVLSGGSRA